MTRNANILSFDEVKAHGALSPHTVSSRRSARPSRFDRSGSFYMDGPDRSEFTHASYDAQTNRASAPDLRSGQGASYVGGNTGSNAMYGRARHGDAARFTEQSRFGGDFKRSSAAQMRSGNVRSDRWADQSGSVVRDRGYLSGDARTHAHQVDHDEADGSYRRDRSAVQEKQNIFQQAQKRFRSAKADRAFEKTIGRREAKAQTEQGSRAALYEMRMGSTHRKSARMQDEGAKRGFSFPFAIPFGGSLSAAATRGIVVAAVAVFTVFMLYPSFQNYYIETRQLQQLQAEYAALTDYNSQMQSQIDYLNTDAGLEDYARSELGWVRENEHVVTVEGVQSSTNATSQSNTKNVGVLSEKVPTPDTWYSGALDVLFGYGS